MKDRTLYILAALFFVCAGILVFWGIQTDAQLGSYPLPKLQPASGGSDSFRFAHAKVNFLGMTMNTGLFVGGICLLAFLYFFPAINAQCRQHRERKAILVLNIFLGWTFLGWIAALVWSFTSQVDSQSANRG